MSISEFLRDFGWHRPKRITQRTLFPQSRLDVLAQAKVGETDLVAWVEKGWLSSTYSDMEKLDDPEIAEIVFVRNLARSGLYADDIDRLLRSLPKPYQYRSPLVAYCFALGWVETLAPSDIEEVFRERAIAWLEKKIESEEDDELVDELYELTFRARIKRKRLESKTGDD